MTKLEQIIDLLRDRELTSLEIASEINIPKNNCSAYLNTLYNDGRIERISNKRPFKYRVAETPKALLKQLYDFMSNYMTIREDKKEEVKQNRDLIVKIKAKIEELIA